MLRQFITSAIVISCLMTCSAPTRNDELVIAALLSSNEMQRKAHMENNADLLVAELADTVLSLNNGIVSSNSKDAINARFRDYFSQIKYTSWDDVQKPVIRISDDGKTANVYVQKLIDTQAVSNDTLSDDHEFALFAWNAEYRLIYDHWKIVGTTSTRKELSEEEAAKLPVSMSEVYATINERDMIAEGVAFDNKTGTLFLSSTFKQKIVAVKQDGSVYDFKAEQEDGLWSTVGMEVDEINNKLWVISSNANEVLPMKYPDSLSEWTSNVFEYQLPDGKLLTRWKPEIEGKYFFNDLCVARSGKVYITESMQNKVYILDRVAKTFSRLEVADTLFNFPNGITVSDNDRYLYIASSGGIVQYDLSQDTYRFLNKSGQTNDQNIDGLAYYKGTLIANQSHPGRIVQFALNEIEGTIISQRILEANNPSFDQPSTGEIAGNTFIYLANAQMRSAFNRGRMKPPDSLKDVTLLKVPLYP